MQLFNLKHHIGRHAQVHVPHVEPHWFGASRLRLVGRPAAGLGVDLRLDVGEG